MGGHAPKGRTIVLTLCACGCAVANGPLDDVPCVDAAHDPSFCCDASSYHALDPALLASAPGSYVNERLAVRGSAEYFVANPGDSCVCSGSFCGCQNALAIRSLSCASQPTPVPVGGQYGGQGVGCTDSGCFPLTPGLSYAVCGQWAMTPFAFEPGTPQSLQYWLVVEYFCEAN